MQQDIEITIQTQAFDANQLINQLQQDSISQAGAYVYFVGMVRDYVAADASKHRTKSLYLEHYPGMCEREIQNICNYAQSKWQVYGIRVVHRVGELGLGEPIVFIGVASTHRTNAFRACEYVIDALKTRAPFWKRESLRTGEQFWVEQTNQDRAKTAQWDTTKE